MRKVWALVLAVTLAMASMCNVVWAADAGETEAAAQTQPDARLAADFQEAAEVLELVNGGPVLAGETASRIDFVTAVTQLLQLPEATQVTDYFFEDVMSFTEHAGNVYAAYQAGWISKAAQFEPGREITGYEAVKLLVNAMGYGIIAENRGGFPTGYMSVARTLNLNDGVDVGDTPLTVDEARLLLLHGLSADTLEKTVYGSKEYFNTRDSLLSRIYDIDIIEGIVSRTEYNTMAGGETPGRGGKLEVEGRSFNCTGASEYDMLGVESRVYVLTDDRDDSGQVVYVRPLAQRTELALQRFDRREDRKLYYWDDKDRERSVTLAPDFALVYNGRKVTAEVDSYFAEGAGQIILMDNGDDGVYDMVFLNRYSYLTALSYDGLNQTLRDKNGAKWTLDLAEKAYRILDANGAEQNLYQVAEGAVYQVIRSLDGEFILARQVSQDVSGTVSRLDGNLIYIDETPYYMSDYFKELFLNQCKTGTSGSFRVTQDGIIISASLGSGGMLYGYVNAAVWKDELERRLEVRIFTQNGDMQTYRLRRRLILDGEKNMNNDQAYERFLVGGAFAPQLVRYAVNGDQEIMALDFASTQPPAELGIYPDDRNRLTRFDFGATEMIYKSGSTSFEGYCTLPGATVFIVPEDLDDLESYTIRNGSNAFLHDQRYAAEVYDLNENGGAGVVVCQGSGSTVYKIHPDNPSMIVKEVYNGFDQDGMETYIVYGWCGGSFVTLTLDKDMVVSKKAAQGETVDSTHPLLSGGDIIRYAVDDRNRIQNLVVVFDGRKGVFAANEGAFNQENAASPMFREGMVYNKGGGYLAVSSTKAAGAYDFSPIRLRYMSSNTSNIASYNAETGEIRPMTVADIRTWKTDGKDAHYAVVCASNFSTKTIILYERMEARQ